MYLGVSLIIDKYYQQALPDNLESMIFLLASVCQNISQAFLAKMIEYQYQNFGLQNFSPNMQPIFHKEAK